MSHTQPEFCYTFRDFDGVFKIGEGIGTATAFCFSCRLRCPFWRPERQDEADAHQPCPDPTPRRQRLAEHPCRQ